MRRIAFALPALLTLAGCYGPPERETAQQWHQVTTTQTLALRFVPNGVALDTPSLDALTQLRPLIPTGTDVALSTDGALASLRAGTVALVLGRPVTALSVAPPTASLEPLGSLGFTRTQLLADSCLDKPQRVGRNLWPGDDADRQALLPPDCAVATQIQRQVVAQDDLLQGRPLAPGAAGPYARAVELYYQRRPQPMADSFTGASPNAPLTQTESVQPGAPSPMGAPDSGQILQGPLPQGGQGSGQGSAAQGQATQSNSQAGSPSPGQTR
jgi:hypothetical protein